jgi:hypothetical protein
MLVPFSESFVGSAYPVPKLFCPWLRKLNAARRKRHAPIDRAKQQAINNDSDYGIVTRFLDSNRGKIAIVAAGEGRGGTIAAGEFLIDPAHLAQVVTGATHPPGKKNMEFVLNSEIIDSPAGTEDGSQLLLGVFPRIRPDPLFGR